MSIRFLDRKNIDTDKWDACIASAFNGLVYAQSWYLDEVTGNWSALVLNDYEAVMPLPWRKKFGIYYLYRPFFCQQLGIFSKNEISQELLNQFYTAIPKKFRLIDLSVNHYSGFSVPGILSKERKNHILPLGNAYEKLRSAYSDNTKRNLKKAAENKLSAKENTSVQDIIKLYKENYSEITPEIQDADYLRLQRLLDAANERNALEAIGIFNPENKLIAAAAFVNDEKSTYYIIGGANEAGKQQSAMHLLFDYIIQKYAGKNKILDFEGSEIEGIARFYKGFGAQQLNYFSIYENRLPFWMKWLKK